ncbi:hypothetical protein Cassandra_0398 [Pseudomonas phage Cassandra]|nr:hypothetical protein Cassandra_0398 [Pseudomonas phage Cassandra]
MYNVYVVHRIVNTGVETNICDIERYVTINDVGAISKFLTFKEHIAANPNLYIRLITTGFNTKKNILELNLSKKEYVVSGFRVTSTNINECIEYYLCRRIFKLHD